VLLRAGVPFHSIVGRLRGDERVWAEVRAWCDAVDVKKALTYSNVALLGGFFPGMCDLYADMMRMTAQFGVHVALLEPTKLQLSVEAAEERAVDACLEEVKRRFHLIGEIDEDGLRWCARVAVGLQDMAAKLQLDGLAYHFGGHPDSLEERIGYSLTLGGSLLAASGVGCFAEGDVLLTVSALIMERLSGGATQAEINVADYEGGISYVGHAGCADIRLAGEGPFLRWLPFFHGKKGSGVSCEFSVRPGPVTLVSLVQRRDGAYRLIFTEAEAEAGARLQNGNVNTRVRFKGCIADFFARWMAQGPSHHSVLSLGHHGAMLRKVASALDIEIIEV